MGIGPRGSKYLNFEASGSKNHTLDGIFGTRSLKYWVLGPLGMGLGAMFWFRYSLVVSVLACCPYGSLGLQPVLGFLGLQPGEWNELLLVRKFDELLEA